MASPLRLNTIRNEEQFYHPPLPAAQPQMVSMPQGGGSAMNTGVQYPDGSPPDTSNVPPAYLPGDQELMSLIDRNLAQPDVSSQPPSSGLQLASNIGSGRESSDWNWITALGAGLQSAGAAHFGNYNVPQQYLQLKQQADLRKQEFAKQQAALEEQKKQHAFQQVTTVLANKDMSETQKASLLDGFAKGENPMIAQFARTAIDGIGKKRMSRIGLYMDRYPTQMQKLAEGASLYDPANISLMHHLYAALRAQHLYNRDQHYVVQAGEVIIVDEFTGRLMTGRRWSDGLHQAVEAKEGVAIQAENQTMASITFQNYFRMYAKLGGMTGTADTEAYEFQEIYGLETVVIPPNRPTIRSDELDLVYKTEREKYEAVVKDIRDCHQRGQPVLVGTTSIENSELISDLLQKAQLPHQVLNAKQHAKEAEIVAQAGRPGVITIATNMAGRGTDIVLGGNVDKQVQMVEADAGLDDAEQARRIHQLRDEWQGLHEQVKAQGGLRIIATERHESRRIDNQLRGRSGRQGDPGASRFYLSLDDALMRIFAGERVRAIMDRLKMPEGEAIEAGIVNRSIESAQRKVEARNFDIRKQLLEYDDVSNDQRKVIYQQRNEILVAQTLHEQIVILSVSVFDVPYVPDIDRVEVHRLAGNFSQVIVQYGFKDEPDIPAALSLCAAAGLDIEMMDASFFLGRETLIPKLGSEMAYWRELLFVTMFRNASSATAGRSQAGRAG